MKKFVFILALLALIGAGAASKAGNPITDLRKPIKKSIGVIHLPGMNHLTWDNVQLINNTHRPIHFRPRDNNK